MSKKVLYVVCTPLSASEFYDKSQTYEFFRDNALRPGVDFEVIFNNSEGLSKRYNRFLTPEYADYIVVFMHDDLIIGYNTRTIERLLKKAHEKFNIVGLAGATRIKLTRPPLWHLMATGMSGSVGHEIDGHTQMSNYGASPQKCVAMDGLFLSVDVEKCLKAGHKFDEQFRFHHYDIDFVIQANEKGMTSGTWPIWVTHMSPGLTSLEKNDWKNSEQAFCKKYNI